ncbi:MAG: hypothetical protein ACLFRR_09435, partial [Spirochaetaceae bacterium]
GAFPAGFTWISAKRYTRQTGEPQFAYDLDIGSHVLFYGDRNLAVSGLGRMIFQSRMPPDRPFYLDPSAVVTDLQLRARFRSLPFEPAVWYRHDCKHDMERETRRQAIHDVLGAGMTERLWLIAAPGSLSDRADDDSSSRHRRGRRLSLLIDAAVEGYVPPLFQDERTAANRAAGYLLLRPELSPRGTEVTVFLETRGAVLVDDPDSPHATAGAVRLDGQARLGAVWPRPERGLTVYLELERLTDSWRRPPEETSPHTLISFGMTLSAS